MLMRTGIFATGNLTVEVRPVNATPLPTTTIAETATVAAYAAPLFVPGWVDIPFSTLTNLSPTQQYCVVVGGTTATPPIDVYFQQAVSPAVSGFYSSSSGNSAGPWAAPQTNSIFQIYVYGTFTSP
jgi:hypothetical protein